jgi:hypothetical protein
MKSDALVPVLGSARGWKPDIRTRFPYNLNDRSGKVGILARCPCGCILRLLGHRGHERASAWALYASGAERKDKRGGDDENIWHERA